MATWTADRSPVGVTSVYCEAPSLVSADSPLRIITPAEV